MLDLHVSVNNIILHLSAFHVFYFIETNNELFFKLQASGFCYVNDIVIAILELLK